MSEPTAPGWINGSVSLFASKQLFAHKLQAAFDVTGFNGLSV